MFHRCLSKVYRERKKKNGTDLSTVCDASEGEDR